MADIDKFLSGEGQQRYVTLDYLTGMLESVHDLLLESVNSRIGPLEELCKRVYDKLERTPNARPLEQDTYLLEVAKTLLTHSAADSPEETSALAYLKGIVDAALPPEEVHTGIDQRAGGEPTGGAESASGAGEGLQSEDQGATIPYEAPHDRGSDPQDRTPQGS